MPWTSTDATRHTKKATTEKDKRLWARIANRLLESGVSEASAIRQANAVIKRRKKGTMNTRAALLLERLRFERYRAQVLPPERRGPAEAAIRLLIEEARAMNLDTTPVVVCQ